jgi:hypothetical protein
LSAVTWPSASTSGPPAKAKTPVLTSPIGELLGRRVAGLLRLDDLDDVARLVAHDAPYWPGLGEDHRRHRGLHARLGVRVGQRADRVGGDQRARRR